MGTLTVRFDPKQMSVWSNRTGVHLFSDAQRNEAYIRAKPFLLEQMRILLEEGWRQSDRSNSDEALIDIYKPKKSTRGRPAQPSQRKEINLTLPHTFDSFLDTSKAKAWRTVFENTKFFKAATQKGHGVDHDLYISSSQALSNIFYLLQVLAPGMLVIYHEHRLPDKTLKVSRMLPRVRWIRRNKMDRVLGTQVMDALLTAATNQKIACHEERESRLRYTASRSSGTTSNPGIGYRSSGNTYISPDMDLFENGTGYDWTACDKDCGWCGRCPY